MRASICLKELSCEIPAACFNRISRIRQESGGHLDFGLPGLGDNVMILSGKRWQLWNRRLGAILLSWEGFRNGERQNLAEPVKCTMKVHHSYSRTVIYRIYESIHQFCDVSSANDETNPGQVIAFQRRDSALSGR